MEQKIAIKIEGPTEEKLPFFFNFLLFLTMILISMTLALLVVELLQIELPPQLLIPIFPQ
jgi:hypothetical protein